MFAATSDGKTVTLSSNGASVLCGIAAGWRVKLATLPAVTFLADLGDFATGDDAAAACIKLARSEGKPAAEPTWERF